jgi:DNA-binding LytR/AlgR family response regulator
LSTRVHRSFLANETEVRGLRRCCAAFS